MHDYLSTPRKVTFENFFQTTGKDDFQGIYRWHQVLSSSFLAVMNDFEIVLRNTVHFALSAHYCPNNSDSFDWMGISVISAQNAPMHIPHQLNGRRRNNQNGSVSYTGSLGKLQDAIYQLNQAGKAVSPDAVVAKLTFAFWPNAINQLRHRSFNQIRQSVLQNMFPHAPSHDISFINQLRDLLDKVRLLRNRLGHHDSLLKFREISPTGTAGFIPQKPRHTIHSLKIMIDNMANILNWIDSGLVARLKASDHWHRLEALLTQEVVGYYRYNNGKACCYERAVAYKNNVEQAKKYQARVKYRRAKYPKEHKQIMKYHF
ncbi:Abi family protein [Vibrio sp. SCSIO 43136]|uniref:Abi family protein n=1 Tax=Vibrio sp. SCSIO 43136 TaxID=2819101 RepID=UPI0020762519|nr:Abi family protein [Vibrio sp. SCSIO 43136]USD68149.1 Abi family protein [Vibrio sp. SCSIO 43136]